MRVCNTISEGIPEETNASLPLSIYTFKISQTWHKTSIPRANH